jgi:hypothetical protein
MQHNRRLAVAARAARILLGTAAGLALLAGCSQPAQQAASPTTTSADLSLAVAPTTTAPPATTAKPVPAAEAAVLRSYKGMWDDLLEVARRPDPSSPLLAAFTTGQQLVAARNRMQGYARRGVKLKGSVHSAPKVVVLVPKVRAIVRDCVDSSNWVEEGGKPASTKPDLHIATLEPVEGTWKVTRVTIVKGRC